MKYYLRTYHFGTVKNGKLDYSVYMTYSVPYDVSGKTLQEIGIEEAVKGDNLSVHDICSELYGSFSDELISDMHGAYQEMIWKMGKPDQIDLITVEFDDLVFIRYCRLGQWFAFAKIASLGFEDQTKWGDKTKYMAIWDGKHWIRPDSY